MAHALAMARPSDRIVAARTQQSHGRLVPLDGLRGIAVLMVILFHWKYLPFGWSGVWLFFSLSGFFIFRNLLAVKQADPNLRLGPFYGQFMIRRCLRLFPLYYLLLLVMTVTVIILHRWDLLTYTVPSLALFIHNLVKPFSEIPHTLYYDHFWSLGVEMHFYLLAPLLVYPLSRTVLRNVLIAIVIASPILRAIAHAMLLTDASFLTLKPGGFIYLISFFHFDAFALGGLAAMHERELVRLGGKAWWLLIVPGVLFVAYAVSIGLIFRDIPFQLFMFEHGQASIGYTLLNLGCAGAICVALVDKRLLHWFLTLPPLLLLGRISYGVYLLHGGILLLTFQLWDTYLPGLSRYSPPILLLFATYLVVTTALAWISFTFFESRFLARPMVSTRALGGG